MSPRVAVKLNSTEIVYLIIFQHLVVTHYSMHITIFTSVVMMEL